MSKDIKEYVYGLILLFNGERETYTISFKKMNRKDMVDRLKEFVEYDDMKHYIEYAIDKHSKNVIVNMWGKKWLNHI